MTQLPTNRTSGNSVQEHVDDHNTLATEHNELDGHAAATTTVHGITDSSTLVVTSDSRLSNARTPTSHHTSHEPGGGDAMAADAAAATASLRTLGTGAAQACAGSDARLSDTRTPTDGSVTNAKVSATAAIAKSKLAALAIVDADVDAAAAIAESKLALASDAAAGTASRRTLGTGATQAAVGSHAHSGTYVPLSQVTAKGDVLAATANATIANLAVGSDGQVLTADAASTPGVKWAAVSTSFATPSVALGTAAAAGSASTAIRSDSTILAFDVTVPTTQAFGDAAATGSAGTAARRDHKHAMPTEFIPGDYGDASDGVINFDGSTTVLGLVPSSSTYTLVRDVFLASGSQVSGTAVIKTANFRIFCRGTFTIGASAVVNNDGDPGIGSAAGAANTSGVYAATTAGSAGVAGGNSGALGAASPGIGGTGGIGGASSGGPGTGGGGSGGPITLLASAASPRVLAHMSGSASFSRWVGGGGGRGGNAAASSTGGGGGAAGGVIALVVYNLVATGLIRAAGGIGGDGSGAGTGAGGGGGGGGGAVILVYHTKSGAGSSFTAATNAPGGTGGAPQGAGKTGAAGSNGAIFEIVH